MLRRKPIPKSGTLAATPLSALPRCPNHLNDVARKEWRRLATPLHDAGIFTLADRAALAAYCVAYARWARASTGMAVAATASTITAITRIVLAPVSPSLRDDDSADKPAVRVVHSPD